MKKSQTEIMGLVILVVLILVSAVFGIRFLMYKGEKLGPELKLSVQAANLQSSLLKLTYNNRAFSDYMLDCCDNKDCSFFETSLKELIPKVLPNQKYELDILKGTKSCYKLDGICQTRVTSMGKITKNGESYRLNILLCS